MKFFHFVGSRKFLKHLGAAVVVTLLILWGVMLQLRFYTRHGDYLTVPDLKGQPFEQIISNPGYHDFVFVVIDSLFSTDSPRGTVLHQDPFPDSKVKQGRKIYLTIVSSIPEKTNMPDLKFLTLRQAISVLESSGLKVGRLQYIQTFDEDAVQQQFFGNHIIAPGTTIEKGSIINLTVGIGSKAQNAQNGGKPDSIHIDTL